MKIRPVILCGGAGTRLWPKQKNHQAKQFIDFGGWSLIQKTLERNNVSCDIIGETTKEKTVRVNKKVSLQIKEIKNGWETSLRKKLLSWPIPIQAPPEKLRN